MDIESCFSADYSQAREKFLQLCAERQLSTSAYHNTLAQTPEGEDLYLDVATMGSADASNLLVLFSGTHGVEGYCGAGIQCALLAEDRLRDHSADLQIALVHAVNPYGFAHDRRVNEDNIDLNRNFLDFANQVPSDNGYSDVHNFLVPEEWEGEKRQQADAGLAQYAQTHGAATFQQAVSGGQYVHPDGLFYGGAAPSWSAQTVVALVKELASNARRACFIDFHTGLGPYGYGEIIAAGSKAQVERTFSFYRDYEVTDPDAGTSSSAPVQGTMAHGVERALPGIDTCFIGLEYGTLPMKEVMTALRADNWLYQFGQPDAPQGREIKRQIRAAFYCDEARWKEMVYARACEIIDTTVRQLS